MLKGKQSWIFNSKPKIKSTGVVGGPFEGKGNLKDDFDYLYDKLWMEQDSFEKAHRQMIEDAVKTTLSKANVRQDSVDFFISGDLINQITPTSFAARTNQIPYLGVFGACSTLTEGLALSALILDSSGAKNIVTGSSSHNAAVERQFRYPTEYGGQKPPTAQWTVTGAGFALLSNQDKETEGQIAVTSATIGKVVDMGLTDPLNMGGAMAPAAAETIYQHFADFNLPYSHYDRIFTGDLGDVGFDSLLEVLSSKGVNFPGNMIHDCGKLIYSDEQKKEIMSGGSGAGCSASVMYGHIVNTMKKGNYKRVLLCATGALLSPMTFQQGETIPCIAHAVSIERI